MKDIYTEDTYIQKLLTQIPRDIKNRDMLRALSGANFIIEQAVTPFAKAEAYRLRASICLDSNELDLALSDLNDAFSTMSKFSENYPSKLYSQWMESLYMSRIVVYINLQNYSNALEDCNRVIPLLNNPEAPLKVNYYLATIFYNTDKLENALDSVDKLLYSGETQLKEQALNLKASILFKQQKYDDAIEIYSTLIDKNPNDLYNYVNRAQAKVLSHQKEEVLEDYKKALLIDPKSIKTYLSRGSYYFGNKEYLKALEDFYHVVDLGEQTADNYSNIALTHEILSQSKKAAEYYKKAIDIDSSSYNNYIKYAQILNELKQFDDAIVVCSELIAKKDLNIHSSPFKSAYILRSKIYYSLNDYDKATKDCQFIIDNYNDISSLEAYAIQANILGLNKDYPMLIKKANSAIKIISNNSSYTGVVEFETKFYWYEKIILSTIHLARQAKEQLNISKAKNYFYSCLAIVDKLPPDKKILMQKKYLEMVQIELDL